MNTLETNEKKKKNRKPHKEIEGIFILALLFIIILFSIQATINLLSPHPVYMMV